VLGAAQACQLLNVGCAYQIFEVLILDEKVVTARTFEIQTCVATRLVRAGLTGFLVRIAVAGHHDLRLGHQPELFASFDGKSIRSVAARVTVWGFMFGCLDPSSAWSIAFLWARVRGHENFLMATDSPLSRRFASQWKEQECDS